MAPIPSRRRQGNGHGGLRPNPMWYREAVIYEIPVRAFCDSNGDGIGDLPGLITKLDYLADLGVTALWLLPFYPSPMRDGGYDISDYTGVDPMFGTLDDFKRLLAEAHERGIRVITELVINHTSKDHPWFERARRSPADSPWREYYVWSDTADRYRDARVIFKDFETSNWSWDPVARAYYWHRFYSHQPDLNFDNPEVHEALFRVCDFWLDMGVDGLRLDAVPYLYEREGTNCENLDETHAFLRRLRAHVDGKYKDRMLLAEANQWPVDAAAYFGNGDECHMNFHFPLMPRLFMSLQLEDRFPIIDILRQTPPIPETCQWATFLRNHDELTLEMVTDQDRDYMYRVYADDPSARLNLGIRRRLAPLLKTRQRIELVYGLLLSLPGTPVLYYGDEIGMGDNIYLPDRDGVRTPMQWSADRNAGFSRANPQKLYLPIITDPEYHYEAVNVEHQESSQHSLLWWTKRLIAVAKKSKVLGTGGIEFLMPENHKILAYMRTREADQVLVVANLSRFPQYVELDLAAYEGKVPFEIFSNVRFPIIGKQPYLLTLSPHTFFWFKLRPMDGTVGVTKRGPDKLLVHETWRELVAPEADSDVALALLDYAVAKRWFRGKARTVKDARVVDRIALGPEEADPVLLLLQVDYMEGDPEVYSIPVVAMRGEEAERREQRNPGAIVARLEGMEPTTPGLGGFQPATLFDAFATSDAGWPLLRTMMQTESPAGEVGRLSGQHEEAIGELMNADPRPAVRAPELEQTNSVLFVGDKAVVKVYRQVESGINPELEIGAFLSKLVDVSRVGDAARVGDGAKAADAHLIPRVLGAVQYAAPGKPPALIALAQEMIANEGEAWSLTQDEIGLFFGRVLSERPLTTPNPPPLRFTDAARAEVPHALIELVGRYFALARQMGQRVGDVHLALGRPNTEPAFAPEPFTAQHQQSIFQWCHTRMAHTFEILRRRLGTLKPATQDLANEILAAEGKLDGEMRRLVGQRIDAVRTRCHGDLHLGQILFTGDDFVIIDFEGEPGRPANERRYKRSPLRDAIGMVRSFNYATEAVLRSGRVRPEDLGMLTPWAEAWTAWVTAAFLGAYLQRIDGSAMLPSSPQTVDLLLDFYEIEKVVYEVEYELNNRPDWLHIPLAGLARILKRRSP